MCGYHGNVQPPGGEALEQPGGGVGEDLQLWAAAVQVDCVAIGSPWRLVPGHQDGTVGAPAGDPGFHSLGFCYRVRLACESFAFRRCGWGLNVMLTGEVGDGHRSRHGAICCLSGDGEAVVAPGDQPIDRDVGWNYSVGPRSRAVGDEHHVGIVTFAL